MIEKRPHGLIASVISSIFIVILIGCSGDGGGGLTAGGGIGGTGITIGAVSGFGSIIVNDKVYDTTFAEIVVDGETTGTGDQVARDALDKGKIVRIERDLMDDSTETVTRVVYNDNVEGPVTLVTDPAIQDSFKDFFGLAPDGVTLLIVMGQPVFISDNTNFKNTTKNDIAEGNVVGSVDRWMNWETSTLHSLRKNPTV
jgi:hypothetical protein